MCACCVHLILFGDVNEKPIRQVANRPMCNIASTVICRSLAIVLSLPLPGCGKICDKILETFIFDNFINVQKVSFFFEQYTSASCYYEHNIFNPSTTETNALCFGKQETIVTFFVIPCSKLTHFLNSSACSL